MISGRRRSGAAVRARLCPNCARIEVLESRSPSRARIPRRAVPGHDGVGRVARRRPRAFEPAGPPFESGRARFTDGLVWAAEPLGEARPYLDSAKKVRWVGSPV